MTDWFSPDYFTARERFRQTLLSAGGALESIQLDSKGPAGEELTVDIGWFGSMAPRAALLHVSGVRGVDGFAGSAIQTRFVESVASGEVSVPDDCAIAIVHAMNAHGMAWLRPANERNVDLGHNFLSADEEYAGVPPVYRALNGLLNPETPPGFDFFSLRLALARLRHGDDNVRNALRAGQFEFPRGLFYGGAKHEQQSRRFQLYLSSRLVVCERIAALEVRCGSGKAGEERVSTSDEGEIGSLSRLIRRAFPAANANCMVQEFGVGSERQILAALRRENRGHHWGSGARVDDPAKTALRDLFCPRDAEWRECVLEQGADAIQQGLRYAFARETSIAADSMTAN